MRLQLELVPLVVACEVKTDLPVFEEAGRQAMLRAGGILQPPDDTGAAVAGVDYDVAGVVRRRHAQPCVGAEFKVKISGASRGRIDVDVAAGSGLDHRRVKGEIRGADAVGPVGLTHVIIRRAGGQRGDEHHGGYRQRSGQNQSGADELSAHSGYS